MYNYENEYRDPEFENSYEFNPEFESEYESEYEMENFQNDYGSGNEYETNPEFETEEEYEYENEFEDEFEFEDEVRDHRTKGRPTTVRVPTRPGYTPSSTTSRPSYRYSGGSWQRTPQRSPGTSWYNKYRTPHRYPTPSWHNKYRSPYYRRPSGIPWYNRHRPYPYSSPAWMGGTPGYPAQPGTPGTPPQPQDSGFNTSSVPQQPQDSGFKNYVLEALKNLTETISTIKNSTPANQPAPGGMDSGTTGTPPAGPPKEDTPPSSEFEMEDYEYYNMEQEEEITDREGTFNEMTEMELASELLSLNNEMELDHFFGGAFKKVLGGLSGILNSPQGKILKDLLKNVAKKGLPLAGAAVGTALGGPLGTAVGSNIGNAASKMFELELEGLSNEDREFEAAKAIVRLSGNAIRQLTEQNTGDPKEDARQALIHASALYAPGLITRKDNRYDSYGNDYNRGYSGGTWRR